MMKSQLQKRPKLFTGEMVKFFTVFILLMSSVTTNLDAQSNAVKAKAYYLTAVNEYKSRNYSKAIEYCQQVEDMLGKTNARVESVRLRSYYDDGKIEKAKKSLQAFLSLDPDEDIMKEVSSYIVKIEEAEKKRLQKEEEMKEENADWKSAQNGDTKKAYQRYLDNYPQGKYASTAKSEIKRIEKEEYNKTHITCNVCNGMGETSKVIKCYTCYGSGKVSGPRKTCPVCHGTGKGAVTYDIWGSRKVAGCSNCHNYGWIREKVTCSKCHGSGERTITKTCEKCFGKGMILKSRSDVFSVRYSKEERKSLAEKASFSEGLAVADLHGKKGYINNEGNEVIPFKYEEAGRFKDGIALVKKDKKYGYIDKKGNEVIKIEHTSISTFDINGLAWYEKPNTDNTKYKWPKAVGVFNKKGEKIGSFVTSAEPDRDYVYCNVAYFLINDNVEPENYRKAINLYALVDEESEEYSKALLALGDIYAEGKGGISKDNTRAFMYYNNAYTKGATLNSNQKEQLGDAYYNGNGVAADKEKALQIYTDSKYVYTYVSTLNYKYVKTAIELKHYDKAESKIAYLESNLAKKYRNDSDLCNLKGLLAESKGDLKAAKKWYKKAKK